MPLRQHFPDSLQAHSYSEYAGYGLKYLEVLCISYIAGDATLFSRCTRHFFWNVTSNSVTMQKAHEVYQILPDSFRGKSRTRYSASSNCIKAEYYFFVNGFWNNWTRSFTNLSRLWLRFPTTPCVIR